MTYEPASKPTRLDDLRSLRISHDRPAPGADPRKTPPWLWAVAGGVCGMLVTTAVGAAYVLSLGQDARDRAEQATVASAPARTPPDQVAGGGIVASGYVTPRQSATVASEVTGRLVRLAVRESQRVRQGDVLAELDDLTARAQVETAVAQAASARAQVSAREAALAEAERDLARSETLARQGFLADAAVQRKRSVRDQAQGELRAARETSTSYDAAIASARAVLRKYVILAPFSGVITSTNAQVGEIISPISAGGGFTRTGICTIVDMTTTDVVVSVSEALISRITAGQPVEVVLDAYPDLRFPARVTTIIPAAERDKSTISVRVSLLKTDPRIFPDMTAKVTFLRKDHEQTTAAF